MNKYILINNFIDNTIIDYYLNISDNYTKHNSKIGNTVQLDKKRRQDIFFSKKDCVKLDKILFNNLNKDKMKKIFNIDIRYRETYKLGMYYSENKGFYNPHTDTQGGMKHRKISFVVCLSDINEYKGGIFKFIHLDKTFKFNKGDAIFFDSNLLHGVEPVIEGKRQVIISFLWDIDGEKIRNKKNTFNCIPYLGNCIDKKYKFEDNIEYHRKIISFSIWGDSEIYNYGLVENVLNIKKYLPEFMVYIYYNNTILDKIFNLFQNMENVVLIYIDNTHLKASNMLWRFKPCFYSNSIVFVRDTDSLINIRDITSMNEFINSKFNFHSIKDSIHHIKYKILGGMWGCKNGLLNTNNYRNLYNHFKYLEDIRGVDQDFLENIYDMEYKNILLHTTTKLLKLNQIKEQNIKIINVNGNHIGSYNHFTPNTRKLLNENNTRLTIKRYYNFYENKHYISCIPPDSGPGNQIISIKECLILSNILDRICIIPPIREHYLKNNTFYNFNEIFNLDMKNCIFEDKDNMVINNKNIDVYTIHSNYLNKKLRHDVLIKRHYNETLLNKRHLKIKEDFEELKNISNKWLVIKHLFNNVYITECGINGCFKDKLNIYIEPIYKNICNKMDFSQTIKENGDTFIKKKLYENYVAIHIRLPDIIKDSLEEFKNIKYTNDILKNKIEEIYLNKPIFIACNNIKFINSLNLNCKYIHINHTIQYSSFIDKYLCCKSNIFYYLNLENTRFGNIHNRSTYTSFILDYRMYLLNNNNNINLI